LDKRKGGVDYPQVFEIDGDKLRFVDDVSGCFAGK
jgi:hypothetical protein